jgi:Zn-dependent alcohol dehydrogenase
VRCWRAAHDWIDILGGGGRSRPLITSLMQLHAQGRFPFDRLVEYFDLPQIQAAALDTSHAGDVIKTILRMP